MAKMKIRIKIELMLLFFADARVNVESKPFCVGTRIKLGFPFFLFHQHVSERIWYCCHCHGESWKTASVRLGPQETLHIFWRYLFIHSLTHSFIYRTNWGPLFCNVLVLASVSLKSSGGIKPGTHNVNCTKTSSRQLLFLVLRGCFRASDKLLFQGSKPPSAGGSNKLDIFLDWDDFLKVYWEMWDFSPVLERHYLYSSTGLRAWRLEPALLGPNVWNC